MDRNQYYTPALNRNLSVTSQSSQPADGRPRRQKSLVRPERERIDTSHRQYHYRQHATNAVPSNSQPADRRPTARQMFVRRGKSILGREEKLSDNEEQGAVRYERAADASFWTKLPDPWTVYCHALTCCFPKQLLSMFGIPEGPAHRAWREKIGLLSFIAVVMAFVGFLTFGFTQAVCPTPPLSVQGGSVSPGYLIIHGWAYMLADWDGHPAISGLTSAKTNVLYPPIDAGGMDASFLFQDPSAACSEVLTPKSSSLSSYIYFPCQLFNPNQTTAPDPSTYSNQTQCHVSSAARKMYKSFQTRGVPKSRGGFDKAARVYYGWEHINATNHLMVYNGDVLNLRLLDALPTDQFSYPAGGLIEAILSDMSAFGGRDMTRAITSYRGSGNHWQREAECLVTTIKVGSLDTLSIGCMASEIVLYLSLVVILGVIVTKFVLAVVFGWFLSWKLGNFKEGGSYAARMKREAEIEAWSRNIHSAGPITKPKSPPPPPAKNKWKKKSILPQTSRFTQPQHGVTRFDADRSSMPVWKTPASARAGMTSRPSSSFMGSSPYLLGLSPSPSSRLFNNNNGSTSPGGFSSNSDDLTPPRRSSISSSDVFSGEDSSSGSTLVSCPFPLSPHVVPQPPPDYMPFNFPLAHTICLVTCYSEGEDGIRTTLDSIATSDYPNSHKLILVICDGIITGQGNAMSTPDACIGMMRDFVVPPDQVEPYPYIAIADGSKQNNMAKVYAGYYKYNDDTVDRELQQRVPMVTIVKCGTPQEAGTPKPGNRGKRDSQIILMQFMQKVIFDERMTQMEYELFNSMWRITGVPPDSYEICLMVDADTKLYPDALSRLISCCVKDPEISGLCGETKIANKTDSWVSMIQVFEYYISHHQSKAFESIFGIVTCLPGCFCMYRIKAPKGPHGYWVPVLANPDIVEHYSENVVDTLHKKNLLLLGEDRYLSTLMLRTFPNRKMMFVPQAVCKTVVPDSFRVLLSQRRRWINSTIHNLMELLFVHDLCGTFCFSMQFVVFMELVGTLALPAAISFTLYLIILAIIGRPAVIPLILLALILGLPAVLIVMTSRKIVYVGWMLVYLISLPIWNFVLPVYAYWHFDDFSWGDTRRVEGNEKDRGHGDKEGVFDSSQVVMKKWSDYEKERRVKLAVERNLPIPRFVERPRSIDIYKDPVLLLTPNSNKPGSAGSSDSEAPLATKEGTASPKQQPIVHVPLQLTDPEEAPNNHEVADSSLVSNPAPLPTSSSSSSLPRPYIPRLPPISVLPGISLSEDVGQPWYLRDDIFSSWTNPALHHDNNSEQGQPSEIKDTAPPPPPPPKKDAPLPSLPPPHRQDSLLLSPNR